MNSNKIVKYNSIFLGAVIFMFGVLKFIDPFKSWYLGQVTMSNLPTGSYWGGILGEIFVGLMLALPFLTRIKQVKKFKKPILSLASFILIIMMIVATYVHIHPGVSSDVLPLKIKPPYIPIFFLILAAFNIFNILKKGETYESI